MYSYVLLLLTVFFCSALAGTGKVPLPDGRVVGGHDADIRQFPHQISMRYNGRHRCGGSILNENVMLSAAHCVVGLSSAQGLTIVAGNTMLSDKSVGLEVVKFIIHESYKDTNNDFDVALLVLKGRLTYNENIQPIELVKERPPVGAEVTVSGWGTLESGASTLPDHLQQVDVNVVSNSKCRQSYALFGITDRMLCAAVTGGGKDACQGDSGGPLIYKGEQCGIVSWGVGCAMKNFPGVYASVAELRDWILKTAKENAIGWA